MLYGEILMPRFPLCRLKGAASRSKMDPNQVNYPETVPLEKAKGRTPACT